MEGMPHANRVDNATSYLPDADPGYRGGGTYTAQNIEPTIEAYENIFGPSARDIKQDLQRFKRHGRWHLPDILKGPNTYLTDRVDGLITDATNSPFTSKILPYKYMDQPDGKIKWNVWSFDEGLASRVPYESAARTLTQSKKSYAGYMVRSGMAIVLEHNFMMSDAGRTNFKRQLQQLVGSIQMSNDLDVHVALILAPSYQKDMREKYIEQDKTNSQICREFIDLFGFVQKNQNAMDILIEEAKAQLKLWGAPMPNFLMCNSKLTFQLTMTPDRTNFVTQGAEGQKRLKAGPDLPSYRGIDIMHTRAFSMEPGAPPRDVLRRRVRVAEYYRIKPHPDNWIRQFQFYNEERDTWFSLSFRELLQYARCTPPVNRNKINPQWPGMNNHDTVHRFANVPLHSHLAAPAEPLNFPMSVPENDPTYDLMRNLFYAIYTNTLKPEYTWAGRKVNENIVYVPGAYQEGIQYQNVDYRNPDNSVPAAGGRGPFVIYMPESWSQLPKPLRDALIKLPRDVVTEYRSDQSHKNIFKLKSQSLQNYPRQTREVAPNYFFRKVWNAANHTGLNEPYENFETVTSLPVDFHSDEYGRGVRQCNANQRTNPYLSQTNFEFDIKHLTRVYHFKQYNRYSIGSNLIKINGYETANTFQNALTLDQDFVTDRQNLQKYTGAGFCRPFGAFYCPNHFKFDNHNTKYASFGDMIADNIIFNSEIVELWTHRRAANGKQCPPPAPQYKLNAVELQWKEKQYEDTFIFDILSHPEKHGVFLDYLKTALQNLYNNLKPSGGQSVNEVTRTKLTQKFYYFDDAALDIFIPGGNNAPFVTQLVDYSNNQTSHWVPSMQTIYHHYWFFPKADKPEEEVLAMSQNDLRNNHMLNLNNLTFKQALLGINIQNFFDLTHGCISSAADDSFVNSIIPNEKHNNFMTRRVPIYDNQRPLERSDALSFVQRTFWRLYGDQELQAPVMWSNNILADIRPVLPLELLEIPTSAGPVPPSPSDPPTGGRGRAPAGVEHMEVVIIRPNIEHFMLGMIMGFGGESLGSTFWGQTELSCYDDSMHGIWGMSYKYHSRATVINFKNLVRIWDVAYDGYVGGKDDSHVTWTNDDELEKFHAATLDVTKHYRGKSMMVMAFDHGERTRAGMQPLYDQNWKANWPSPIMFYDDGGVQEPKLPLEYDNIHVVDTGEFRVFNNPVYQNSYRPYYDKMPNFTQLHKIRKNAALAAVENEVSSDSLAFQGTMRVLDSQGHMIEEIHGSGHHGPDFIGVASLRAGKGYKFATQPSIQRLV